MTSLIIPTATLDLVIPQYAGYSFDFTYKIDGVAVNLTGYTGLAQIRDQEDRLQAAFAIVLGGALGTVSLTLTAAQTGRMKDGAWDLLLTPSGGQPFRLLQGKIEVSPGVSRSGS